MVDTTAFVFSRHLSLGKIDMDDMLVYIQNLHGLLRELSFDSVTCKYEKINRLISGLREVHPTALSIVLDYLDANDCRAVAYSICQDVTRRALNSEEQNQYWTRSPVVDTESINGNKSLVAESPNANHPEVEPTITAASKSLFDSVEIVSKSESFRARDAVVMTEIVNDGISKEIVDKMVELDCKHKQARIVRIGGIVHGKAFEIFHPTNSSVQNVSKDLDDFIPVSGHQCHLIDKNQILVIGGRVDGNYLQLKTGDILKQTSYINLKTFAVKPGPSLPEPIAVASVASLIGTLYICGGGTKYSVIAAVAACYKLVDGNHKWVAIRSLNIARLNHTMSGLNGHLYVIGGLNVIGESLKSVECYDPLSDKWIMSEIQMNDARHGAASLVHRGKIYVTGGGKKDSGIRKTTEVFDPTTETWSYGSRLNRNRSYHSMLEFCGKMYVIGGFQDGESMEVFNDDTNEWELVNHKLERECYHGAFVVLE